jgi:hypothetical protein
MIVSFVSKYRKVGKNHACETIVKSKVAGKVQLVEFTSALKVCADLFMDESHDKHSIVPWFGVSKIDVVNAISGALERLHPEIPVMKIKDEIERLVIDGWHVLIPDVRRQREFEWLDMIAERHGFDHHILEVFPVDKEGMMMDTWQSATGEPCGYEVWRDRRRSIIANDGTEDFDAWAVSVFRSFLRDTEKHKHEEA